MYDVLFCNPSTPSVQFFGRRASRRCDGNFKIRATDDDGITPVEDTARDKTSTEWRHRRNELFCVSENEGGGGGKEPPIASVEDPVRDGRRPKHREREREGESSADPVSDQQCFPRRREAAAAKRRALGRGPPACRAPSYEWGSASGGEDRQEEEDEANAILPSAARNNHSTFRIKTNGHSIVSLLIQYHANRFFRGLVLFRVGTIPPVSANNTQIVHSQNLHDAGIEIVLTDLGLPAGHLCGDGACLCP